MTGNKGNKKIIIAILAVIIAILAVLYLIFAERIAGLFENLDPKLGYSDIAGIYENPPKAGSVEIHIIDVGQGDSILIRSSSGNILIDAGTSASEPDLKAHLDACKVKSIDYFFCTHPHDDHIGGADMILDSYEIGRLILTDAPSAGFAFEKLLEKVEEHSTDAAIAAAGDKFAVGDMTFTVLAPISSASDANDYSLVIKMVYEDISFLFMGDAGFPVESEMLLNYPGEELDCDFIKIGHHGANTSTGADFLNAVTPDIAAISCGKNNEYGHPRGEMLARLADSGCKTVLRTDRHGTAVVLTDGKVLTAITDNQIK